MKQCFLFSKYKSIVLQKQKRDQKNKDIIYERDSLNTRSYGVVSLMAMNKQEDI